MKMPLPAQAFRAALNDLIETHSPYLTTDELISVLDTTKIHIIYHVIKDAEAKAIELREKEEKSVIVS